MRQRCSPGSDGDRSLTSCGHSDGGHPQNFDGRTTHGARPSRQRAPYTAGASCRPARNSQVEEPFSGNAWGVAEQTLFVPPLMLP